MAKRGPLASIAYWVKWAALNLWGPADQDRASDPVQRLKREYGHPQNP